MNSTTDILVKSVKLIDETNQWDRIKDWSDAKLSEQFRLDEDDTRLLAVLVLCRTNSVYSAYDLPAEKGQLFLETVQEAVHQGFDGWSEREQLVIEAFIGDVAYAMTLM